LTIVEFLSQYSSSTTGMTNVMTSRSPGLCRHCPVALQQIINAKHQL